MGKSRKLETPETTEGSGKSKVREFKPNRRMRRNKDFRKDCSKAAEEKFSFGNDLSWWTKFPELAENSAVVKCNFIPGTDLTPNSFIGSHLYPEAGIEVQYSHTYGRSIAPTDALNLMARDLFLRQFRKYRGISNYQAADMMMAIIAGIEVISMVAHLERIYGVLRKYDRMNQNMPQQLLSALGVTPTLTSMLQGRLADFRYDLNLLIRKATKICAPKDMSVMADRVALDGYVYKDHESKHYSQFIVFNPQTFGVFVEGLNTPFKTGSTVVFARVDDLSATCPVIRTAASQYGSTLFPLLECMIDNLLSDSVQQIYGNLLAWFGEDNLITLLPLPDDFEVEAVYSEEILHKLHNCEYHAEDYITSDSGDNYLLGSEFDVSNLNDLFRTIGSYTANIGGTNIDVHGAYTLYQYDNKILATPTFWDPTYSMAVTTPDGYQALPAYMNNSVVDPEYWKTAKVGFMSPHILDSYHEDFNVETVLEGSLFKIERAVLDDQIGGSYSFVRVYSVGFESIDRIVGRGAGPTYQSVSNNIYEDSANTGTFTIIDSCATCAPIDWSPVIRATNSMLTNTRIVSGDIDTVRLLSADELIRLHNTALNSGLYTAITVKD